MLRLLLDPDYQKQLNFELVGVATDDPTNQFSNPQKRGTWRYGYDPDFDPKVVPRIAARHALDAYGGSLRTPEFVRRFQDEWKPDLCLVNVYGQILRPELFEFPTRGSFNFHSSSGPTWPAFQGADPVTDMIKAGCTSMHLVMHHVAAEVDAGAMFKCSVDVPFPPNATVADMHYMTAPLAVSLLRETLPTLLQPRG